MPTLLVCEEGSASDEEAKACRARFEGVAAEHWTYLPSFVDQYDDLDARSRTVGVHLTLPEPEEGQDEEAVQRDVQKLVSTMSDLARQERIEFVIEYRGEAVGWLDGSPADTHFVAEFFGTA
jgi:hypothetical protein